MKKEPQILKEFEVVGKAIPKFTVNPLDYIKATSQEKKDIDSNEDMLQKIKQATVQFQMTELVKTLLQEQVKNSLYTQPIQPSMYPNGGNVDGYMLPEVEIKAKRSNTKYKPAIDKNGGTTPSEPTSNANLIPFIQWLALLAADTATDQIPGNIVTNAKAGFDMYKGHPITSALNYAKIPATPPFDALINILQNNPSGYDTEHLDDYIKKQFRKKASPNKVSNNYAQGGEVIEERDDITDEELQQLFAQGYDVEIDGVMHYAKGGKVKNYKGGGGVNDPLKDVMIGGIPFYLAPVEAQNKYLQTIEKLKGNVYTAPTDNTRVDKKTKTANINKKQTLSGIPDGITVPTETVTQSKSKTLDAKIIEAVNRPFTTFANAATGKTNDKLALDYMLPTPENTIDYVKALYNTLTSSETYKRLDKAGVRLVEPTSSLAATNEELFQTGMDALTLASVIPVNRLLRKGKVNKLITDIPSQREPMINSPSGVSDLVSGLRKELKEKGIVSQQLTSDSKFKENARVGVKPYGYNIKEKVKGVLSMYKDIKNPQYKSDKELGKMYDSMLKRFPNLDVPKEEYMKDMRTLFSSEPSLAKVSRDRFNSRFTNPEATPVFSKDAVKNRYATWDMYLGYPQKEHPMYDISTLTKSKDDIIYTIKPDFMDKKAANNTIENMIEHIENPEGAGYYGSMYPEHSSKKGVYKFSDTDFGYFGTMGGFNWEIEKLADGNYKVIANDIWDLQPTKGYGTNLFTDTKIGNAINKVKDFEAGTTLGIGKPLNVKVGFIVDGKTKKIINTFGLAPAALGVASLLDNEDKTKKK